MTGQKSRSAPACFHCQYYCVSLCDVIRKMEETIRMHAQILAYFVTTELILPL